MEWMADITECSWPATRYNMQKVTYVLLQRHANSYWQTERDDDIRSGTVRAMRPSSDANKTAIVASPAKRRRPATICAVSEGKEPFPGLNEMMSKLAERENTSNTPPTKPGIQHHNAAPKPLSRPTSNATLKPVVPPVEAMEDTLPPPVPPKPIVIRADQIYNEHPQWQQQHQSQPQRW